MAVRGNQSRFKPTLFSVKFVTGRGYAVVNEVGAVVGAFTKDRHYAQASCEAKTAAMQRAAKVISRPCLRCAKPFDSAGIHNRMCGNCRHASSAEGEPVGYSFGAMTGRRR